VAALLPKDCLCIAVAETICAELICCIWWIAFSFAWSWNPELADWFGLFSFVWISLNFLLASTWM